MLRTYNLTMEEHFILYTEMSHPDVSPYVRNYVNDFNEYISNVNHILEAENRGEMIVRVIVNEWNRPIGLITLYDITEYGGFLSTWLGKDYHGSGYNKVAKELFFNDIFDTTEIQTVFMKIRVDNYRSQKAALKLAYVAEADYRYQAVHTFVNQTVFKYNLYTVTKQAYLADQKVRQVDYVTSDSEIQLSI
ncbi:MAG TPA: GNAT family protein [Pseudogracilibacillus sp.]|nr:GNAT family protein [Pseudogracilibacillus sp.]